MMDYDSFPGPRIEYEVRGRASRNGFSRVDELMRSRETRTGIQVGRLAVRKSAENNKLAPYDRDSVTIPARAYILDHLPSGIALADFHEFKDAMLAADEISRHSVADLDTDDGKKLADLFGPEVTKYIMVCQRLGDAIPFRDYLAELDRAAQIGAELAAELGLPVSPDELRQGILRNPS